jgi:multidrug efflux pump subunit AcrA (membrane-fusion protein)
MTLLTPKPKNLTRRRKGAKRKRTGITFAPLRLCVILAVLFCAGRSAIAAESSTEPLEVQSVVLRLIAEAEVPAREAGVLTAVPVREGQRVKKGDVLAQIDDEVARMAERDAQLKYDVAHAKATNDVQVRFSKKAAEVAEAELARSTDSNNRFAKSVSQSQLDVEKLNVEKTRLEAEQATQNMQIATLEMKAQENELDAVRVNLGRQRIVAPFDGTVVQVFVRLGEWVEPGEKAVRIVNAGRLRAEGFLPAEAADDVAPGTPVKLTVDLPRLRDVAFDGTIAFVSPEVDPITGQVRLFADIDNRDGRLRPGQPVRMVVVKPESVVRSP